VPAQKNFSRLLESRKKERTIQKKELGSREASVDKDSEVKNEKKSAVWKEITTAKKRITELLTGGHDEKTPLLFGKGD